jgi:hypothetical protein
LRVADEDFRFQLCSGTLGLGIIAGKARKSPSVLSLALAFVDITLHRRGPDELPPSGFLLGVLVALYVSTGFIGIWTLGVLDAGTAQLLLLDFGFFLAYVFVSLRLFRHDGRFPQTVIAPMLLHLLLLFWWIDVAGFILSRAIGRPYFVGVLFMIVYVLTSYRIGNFLFPRAS